MIDVWVQVIDPTIPNLLPDSTRQSLRQVRPTRKRLLARRSHHFHDDGIFVIGPLPLADAGLEVANPALVAFLRTASVVSQEILEKARNVPSSSGMLFRNRFPVTRILILLHNISQALGLVLRPAEGSHVRTGLIW